MDTNSNEAASLYSEVEDVGNTEEIPPMSSVKSSDEVEIDWDALIANTNITTRPISSKPRRTFEEYVSTQKVYDVLKEPEDGKPLQTSLTLKTTNMNSKKRKSLNPFLPFINVTLNEQHATNFMDGRNSKSTTVKISNDGVIAAAPTTASVDDTTTITNTTISATPATTTNPIELKKSATTTTKTISTTPATTTNTTEVYTSATNSIVMPLESDISNVESPKATTTTNITISTTPATTTNTTELYTSATNDSDISNAEPPAAITTTSENKSSTSNTASPASTTIAATTINEITTTNTTPIVASSANSTIKQTTSIKKSVMRPVRIPLSIASKAHKSITLKGQKIPIHPLIKSRNCVLLSTTSRTTDASKGIIKCMSRNSRLEKYTADKCNDSNTTDSNSGETSSNKESEEVTAVDKEILVTTSDNNTEKTAVNLSIVPLVGKRKYTDPATMPILSFSYQKSLADYIRKAKEFHKRAKMCSAEPLATIDNTNCSEENMVSNDIDGVNSKVGNDETNMECDDESNVAQCKSNENPQSMVTAMDVEEMTNTESEISENVTAECIEKAKDMKATETINNTKEMEITENMKKAHAPLETKSTIDNLEEEESTEDTENTKDAQSITSIDNLKNFERAENTEALNDVESNESIDDIKAVESTDVTKNLMENKSAESTHNQNDLESDKPIETLKDIESAEISDNLKDVVSAEGSKNPIDIDLSESTGNLKDKESAGDTKTLEDIESAESTDNLKDKESAENTENPTDIDLSESTDNDVGSGEATNNLKNIESTEDTDNPKNVELAESTKNLTDIESTERCDNLNDVESAEGTKTIEDIDSAAGTENLKDMDSVQDVDNTKNITTTSDMGNQIDIESDLCTYEIFNNVSGISNASRNQLTQTKDSTLKILKNIWELKEKVQQQAEEIMSLKAAMKCLNTTNVLNKS